MGAVQITNSHSPVLLVRCVGVVLLDHRVSLGAKHDSVVGAGAIPSDAKENRHLTRHADEKSVFRTDGTPDETPERAGKAHKGRRTKANILL